MKFELNERRGEILVGLALAIRGSSLLFGKIAMESMGPFLLIALRFLIAFVVMRILFYKHLKGVTKRELVRCAVIGLCFFVAIAVELVGLQTTTATVTSFLEGTVVVIVPFMVCILQRKLPDKMTVIAAFIALLGIGFLTLKGDRVGFSRGEILVLLGGFWYSGSVIVTDKAAKDDDPLHIAVFQLIFISFFAFIGAIIFEEVRLPANGAEWGSVLALALICSGVGFTLQPLGQKYTTPERAGLLAAANPLSASALGIIFLGEKITPSILVGATLILISIVLPAWIEDRKKRSSNPPSAE